ncbi:MAG: EthD family reductase [Candidatus Binatia bacterium]
MVKVSVFYAYDPGKKFDMDYYCKHHMALVKERFGSALKSIAVEQGVAGGEPGAPPKFIAMGHMYFDSADAFHRAFAPHAEEIVADVKNYTDLEPMIQISEVKM